MRMPVPFGKYVLVDRIAIGGMAEVFAAVRSGDPDGRPVAVKRILPLLAEDEDLVVMFLDEARLLVQLEHPGIPSIHELGRHDTGYFIAMEYVAGRDLRSLIDRFARAGERLPVPLAAHVAARVADALDHAHRRNGVGGDALRVVHRDVCPANVLLGYDGRVRIIDFGIALASFRTGPGSAVLRGKFGYMSPEMVRGLPVDRRSDVFSLGVVLHEMLTGARLFTGPSELAVMEKVRAAVVRPPSARNPAVPPELDEVVLRALAREPEGRYAWASDLRDALLAFARGVDPLDPAPVARAMATVFPDELAGEERRRARMRQVATA